MLKKVRPEAAPSMDRRRFLAKAGLLSGAAGIIAAMPAWASSETATPRTLRFVHTHTGERLTAPYFDGKAYDVNVLEQVNHVLRDFRTNESHSMDPKLLDLLHALQTRANYDAPFAIIGGYRSPATNAMLHATSTGVAEHSQHLLGKAIDLRLDGYSTRRLSEQARALARGGVGYYAASDFVHVDTGRVRNW